MEPRINRNRGKRTEKAVAKLTNGIRIGLLGKDDVISRTFSIECKSRKRFGPRKWLLQAEKNASKGKIPIVFVHELGSHYESGMVLIGFKDFKHITDL